MNDAEGVSVVESLGGLVEYLDHLGRRQPPFPKQAIGKRFAFKQLHDDERCAIGHHAMVEHLDDVWALDLGGR